MIIKQTMYVHRREEDGKISLFSHDMTHGGTDDYFSRNYTMLGTVEIEVDFDMPSDLEIRDKKVSMLNDRIEQERASSENYIQKLRDEIQKLMAISHE